MCAGAGQTQVLDFVDYNSLTTDESYGSFPDGQSFLRQTFFHPTPGAPLLLNIDSTTNAQRFYRVLLVN